MKAIEFRVQNFRNVEDSGWIKLDRITAFVGRNESGKTTLIKALHKFNPAFPEPYDAMREFPRDRYIREYIGGGSNGGRWPVCSVRFDLDEQLKEAIYEVLPEEVELPAAAVTTRYYDGKLTIEYEPAMVEPGLSAEPLLTALKALARGIRRIAATGPEDEEATTKIRDQLLQWVATREAPLKNVASLRNAASAKYLATLKTESDAKSNPKTADLIEAFQEVLDPILKAANAGSVVPTVDELVRSSMPVFIYFENYGVLDSAVYLPRLLDDLRSDPTGPRTRTINAMFKHVGLDAKEITELGNEEARDLRKAGQAATEQAVANDQRRKEERAIRLNSASNSISTRFSDWWSQRRHKIRYHADGDYFRVWIADDRRPDVEIELESRSKGFQWFFSFYLVFLVESEEGHKDAILLLDEPGLNLHPTAQQELLGFFENLAERNQLAYTTHSPFLVDGENIHRVRPVTEDSTGHSRISAETWPSDRETIFPLQAAAGYAMLRGLFQHKKNLLVEGMSDYYYLHALNQQCRASGLAALPEDVYITPCGGTKLVGTLASLFLGQNVRPVILLDADEAARVRRAALLKELYVSHESHIVMLDAATGHDGAEYEIEDVLGEEIVLPAVRDIVGAAFVMDDSDRAAGSLPSQIKAASKRLAIDLPEGWKATVALALVAAWAESGLRLPTNVLETAGRLFRDVTGRFEG